MKIDDRILYFHKIAGEGEIHCMLCNYSESIINFIHGIEHLSSRRRTGTIGYQCTDCGKFHAINGYEGESDIMKNCDCGGALHRDKPLFCPSCKSQSVGYLLRYI